MKAILKFLFFLNTTSIDIALGVLVWLVALRLTFHVQLNDVYYLLIFAGTLVVYWLDHCFDWILHPNPSDYRADFFGKNFKLMTGLTLVISSISLVLAYIFLPAFDFWAGCSLSLLMLCYLLFHRFLHKRTKLKKELLISLLYVVSIFFPIWVHTGFRPILLSLSAFYLVLVHAILSVAHREWSADQKAGISNFFDSGLKYRLNFNLIAAFLFLFSLYRFNPLPLSMLISLLPVALFHHLIFKGYFPANSYRLISEWSFTLSAVLAIILHYCLLPANSWWDLLR